MNKAFKKATNRKVAIIGAGNVGASIAYALNIKGIAEEIVLIDQFPEKAKGEAMDIRHGISAMPSALVYEGGYNEIANSDLIVVTAGRNRMPGETRIDLTFDNVSLLKKICDSMMPFYNRKAVVMVVANPVDILTQKMTEWLHAERGRVIGTGCILDTSRFVGVISDYLNVSADMISGFIAGEHGDAQFPVWSQMTVNGNSISEFCKTKNLEWSDTVKKGLEDEVVQMGGKIIKAKGKTHYGIATCVCYLADVMFNNRGIEVCLSSELKGEYGMSGVSLSVPTVLCETGVDKILLGKFSEEELSHLRTAGDNLKKILEKIK